MTKDEAQQIVFEHVGRGLKRERIARELQAAEKQLTEALVAWSKATTAAALVRMADDE
jgi:hypothetical protein